MEGILRFCKVGVGGFAVNLGCGFGQFDKVRYFNVTFSVLRHLINIREIYKGSNYGNERNRTNKKQRRNSRNLE